MRLTDYLWRIYSFLFFAVLIVFFFGKRIPLQPFGLEAKIHSLPPPRSVLYPDRLVIHILDKIWLESESIA